MGQLGLERLSGTLDIAKFLGTPEDTVLQFIEEGRLGGALVAALKRRGAPVTPSVKNSVEAVVRAVTPENDTVEPSADGSYLLSSEATATIMFTDIVGSTPLIERLGDRKAGHLLGMHNSIIDRHTKANGGVVVKSMGDGLMLTFPSARRGVACAVDGQRALAAFNEEHPQAPLAVRMGLSVGEPVRENHGLFGRSVIVAARISAMAQGGQVLISQVVHALVAGTREFSVQAAGRVRAKGHLRSPAPVRGHVEALVKPDSRTARSKATEHGDTSTHGGIVYSPDGPRARRYRGVVDPTRRQGAWVISDDTREALAGCELFQDITRMQLMEAAALVEEFSLGPAEMMIREGEPALHLFVVVEGNGVAQIEIDRGCISLGLVTPGEVAGWSSLLRNQVYPASVKALTSMRVARIETSGLSLLMNLEPGIGYPVHKRLSTIFHCQYETALKVLKSVE